MKVLTHNELQTIYLKNNNVINVDMDNVMFDTLSAIIEKVKKMTNKKIEYKDITNYEFWNVLNIPKEKCFKMFTNEFFFNLKPIEKAIEVTERLAEKYPIVVVTAWSKNEGKIAALKKHFPHITGVLFEGNKAKAHGKVLIDDRTKYLVDFINQNRYGICFDYKGMYYFNKNFDETRPRSFRARSWEEVENIIGKIFSKINKCNITI